MTAKVRIKAGPVEFEYEGETEFSIDDVKDLFSHIETLFTVPSLAKAPSADEEGDGEARPATKNATPKANGTKLHINSIASKLGAKTGSQLALAAGAYLQIMEGRDSFSRSELLKTMQGATLHYKKSMSGNLTKHISTLVGDKFNQIAQDKYSLKSDIYSDLEAKLAE